MILWLYWSYKLSCLCYSDSLWGGGPQPTRLGMLVGIADATRGPSSEPMDVSRKRNLTRPWDHTVDGYVLETNSKWMILYYWITYICILTYNILLEQAQADAAPDDAPAPDDPPATADVLATAPIGHEHNSSEYTDASSSNHGGSSGSSSSS